MKGSGATRAQPSAMQRMVCSPSSAILEVKYAGQQDVQNAWEQWRASWVWAASSKQMGQTKGVAGGVVVALANEDWDWESGLVGKRRAGEFGSSA